MQSSAGSPDYLFCSVVLEISVALFSLNKPSRSGGAGGDSSPALAPGGDAAPAPGGDASAAIGSAGDTKDESKSQTGAENLWKATVAMLPPSTLSKESTAYLSRLKSYSAQAVKRGIKQEGTAIPGPWSTIRL